MSDKEYYWGMLSELAGLEDDLDANSVPDRAKQPWKEVLEICRADFIRRFETG